MKRGDVYGVLVDRLEQFRSFGYEQLLRLVNEPAVSETARVNNEDVVIDIAVLWKDKKRRILWIWGTASGPSTWEMERLDEQIVVGPGQ